MQPLVFLLFVAVINVGVCQPPHCDIGWIFYEHICYSYGEQAVSWAKAQAICETHGATLAEVPSIDVSHYLMNMAWSNWHHCVWLGGNDKEKEGVWVWTSKSYAFNSFKQWHSIEPTALNPDEDCLSMHYPYNYYWNDGNCFAKCNYICAKVNYYRHLSLPKKLVETKPQEKIECE
ncbi:hypothetical protein BsWGS_12067 [Bradybaena similaris]